MAGALARLRMENDELRVRIAALEQKTLRDSITVQTVLEDNTHLRVRIEELEKQIATLEDANEHNHFVINRLRAETEAK